MSTGPNYKWFHITINLSITVVDDSERWLTTIVSDAQATNPVTALNNVVESIFRRCTHTDGRKLSIYDVEENIIEVKMTTGK